MAILGKFAQTPSDNKLYTIDYSQWLNTGETLSGVPTFTIQQTTVPPLAITGAALVNSNTGVSFFVGAGLSGNQYEIEVVANTSLGQTKNDQIYYNVQSQ